MTEPTPTRTQDLSRHSIDITTHEGVQELWNASETRREQLQHLAKSISVSRPTRAPKQLPVEAPLPQNLAARVYLSGVQPE